MGLSSKWCKVEILESWFGKFGVIKKINILDPTLTISEYPIRPVHLIFTQHNSAKKAIQYANCTLFPDDTLLKATYYHKGLCSYFIKHRKCCNDNKCKQLHVLCNPNRIISNEELKKFNMQKCGPVMFKQKTKVNLQRNKQLHINKLQNQIECLQNTITLLQNKLNEHNTKLFQEMIHHNYYRNLYSMLDNPYNLLERKYNHLQSEYNKIKNYDKGVSATVETANVETVYEWIVGLENGYFHRYNPELKNYIFSQQINGESLKNLTINELPKMGVYLFRDQYVLFQKIQNFSKLI